MSCVPSGFVPSVQRLQRHEHIGEHGADQQHCGNFVTFIADIIRDRAADRRTEILPDIVSRLTFGGTLQKKNDQSRENGESYPIEYGFQNPAPLQRRDDIAYSCPRQASAFNAIAFDFSMDSGFSMPGPSQFLEDGHEVQV